MEGFSAALVIAIVLAIFVIFVVLKTAVVVPQQNAFVVERLGKFHAVLDAGFHVLFVITELDKATGPWGIKVLRYEIKNITPPQDVLAAMEKQMRAEREKRAVILSSEGERDAAINTAEGKKQQVIKESEAHRQRQINEAEGQAQAILAVATATAEGLRQVATSISQPGGPEAVQLRVAEQYVGEFGRLARTTNTVILPANLSDVGSMIALATSVLRAGKDGHEPVRNTVVPPPERSRPAAGPVMPPRMPPRVPET
jgi:regulator of protease activity HflC (stomatin/prohibitin superfamily)